MPVSIGGKSVENPHKPQDAKPLAIKYTIDKSLQIGEIFLQHYGEIVHCVGALFTSNTTKVNNENSLQSSVTYQWCI